MFAIDKKDPQNDKRIKKIVYYSFCFCILGLIDWSRSSLDGVSQMIFANLMLSAVAFMVLPEVKFKELLQPKYILVAILSLIGFGGAVVAGRSLATYSTPWNVAAFGFSLWAFLIVYLFMKHGVKGVLTRLANPWGIACLVMCIFMIASRYTTLAPACYMVSFVGLYLFYHDIEDKDAFWVGVLYGVILFFAIMQAVAFGFRPYDRTKLLQYTGIFSHIVPASTHYSLTFVCMVLLAYRYRNNPKKWIRALFFVLSAMLLAFMVYVGQRAVFVGNLLILVPVFVLWNPDRRKRFATFIGRYALLGLLTIVLLVPVYCSIRYLPTILRHPIWFEGEYSEEQSVRSFDPIDSDRYVTLKEGLEKLPGRFLLIFGVNVSQNKNAASEVLTAEQQLAKQEETRIKRENQLAAMWNDVWDYSGKPGSSPDNPYTPKKIYLNEGPRTALWEYHIKNSTFRGHTFEERFVYIAPLGVGDVSELQSPHNQFIGVLYNYGWIPGVLLMALWIVMVVYAMINCSSSDLGMVRLVLALYLLFPLMTQDFVQGNIVVSILGILFATHGFGAKKLAYEEENRNIISGGE